MDCLCSRSLRAGYVAWPDGRRTLIVKLTFDVVSGKLVLSEEQTPLHLDIANDAGELVYPSDYAPFKPRCDIAIVEETVEDRGAEGTVQVGPLTTSVAPLESLSPRETFCPLGDPNERAAFELWTTGGVDFSRFQVAPPQRRLPWIDSAFELDYQRGNQRIFARFEAQAPSAAVLDPECRVVVAPIGLNLDTILFHAAAPKIWMVFRGVYAYRENTGTAIDGLRSAPLDDTRLAQLAAQTLAAPRSVSVARVPSGVSTDETRVLSGPIATAGLPFRPAPVSTSTGPGAPASWSKVAPVSKTVGQTMEELALSEGTGPDSQEHTRAAPVAGQAHAAPLPFPSQSEPNPNRLPITATDLAKLRLERAPASAPSWGDDETQVLKDVGTPNEANGALYEQVQQEIWRAEESVGAILARHGLTEESWRAIRRAHKPR